MKKSFVKNVIYFIILMLFIIGLLSLFRYLRRPAVPTIDDDTDVVVETNVVLGDIISAKLINYPIDINVHQEKYYIIVRIEGQLFTIDNEDLYNGFLYRNKRTELFLVYDKLIKDKNDPEKQIRVERTIYSIFE